MSENTIDQVHLSLGQQSLDCPIIYDTYGNKLIDISQLRSKTGYTTYDPGLKSTALCPSHITYIDEKYSKLYYRGHDVEDLCDELNYLQTCYLLINGKKPSAIEYTSFVDDINAHTMVHEQLKHIFSGVSRQSHPMSIMLTCVGALSAQYHDRIEMSDPISRQSASVYLLAKLPTIAAMIYKHQMGHPINHPNNSTYHTDDFLRMMFQLPTQDYHPHPSYAKALDRILILHADHELNASTSVVRSIASTGAKTYEAIAGGIAALWGPAHGGANEACLNMLEHINSEKNIDAVIQRAKDKDDAFRLMGVGHRVYKSYDPRARAIRHLCHEVLKHAEDHDGLLETALKLEHKIMNDEYFVSRQLFPNVDFYSGIILKALGIPKSFFTLIFVLGRIGGWLAHIEEMHSQYPQPIVRPRQLYLGKQT